MTTINEVIREFESRDKLDIRVVKDEASDSVHAEIRGRGSIFASITFQNSTAPEFDTRLAELEAYASFGNSGQATEYLKQILDDLEYLVEHREQVVIKRVKLFGVAFSGWHIAYPANLKVLRTGPLLKILPGQSKGLTGHVSVRPR